MSRWPDLSFAERLYRKIDGSGGDDTCHQWTGARTSKNGVKKYGHLIDGSGKTVLAHRAVWELEHGAIAPGFQVMHSCDNPQCCNLRHLSLGTNRDNSLDAIAKGRAVRCGKRCAAITSRLRQEMKHERQNGGRIRDIARQFGVSYGAARYAVVEVR